MFKDKETLKSARQRQKEKSIRGNFLRRLKYRIWYKVRPFLQQFKLGRKRFSYLVEHRTRPLRTRLRPPQEYAIFIDNNVFTELLRREKGVWLSFFQPFFDIEKWSKDGDKFHFATTPFLLFEYLWVKIPQPPAFDFRARGYFDRPAIEAIKAVYDDALDFYWRVPTTGIAHLFLIYQEQKKRLSPAIVPFFEQLVGNYMIGRLEGPIHAQLAYDIAAKTLYPKHMREKSHLEFIVEAVGRFQQGLNLSAFRKFSEMSLHIARTDDWHLTNEEKNEILTEVSLKTHGDYVDSELPMIAVTGWHVPDGPHVPVHCFTCDRPEEVESRVISAKAVMSFGYWAYKRAKRNKIFPREPLKKLKPGVIHCLEPKTLRPLESFNIDWII